MNYILKAPDRDTMDAKLLELGILVQGDEGLRPATKTNVTGYGGADVPVIYTTKPVYAEDGTVTTEGVLSTEYHCNVLDLTGIIRNPEPFDEFTNPSGTDWGAVEVIDPSTVSTPASTWA